jgi:tripartite-type tricarboxylate transporter receptor subunit TctC
MLRMKALLLALALFSIFVGSVWINVAYAAGYPARPLEIICPYAPGSTTDIALRVITDVGSKHFGQPMVVVNKPGAGGALAAADVISSKPDGYKAFWGAQVFFATTTKTQKVPFNPDDLAPLANFVELKMGMVVRADSPFKTFDDLLDYAKKSQGQFKWAHVGRGITLHMSGLIIFKKAGIATVDVPYKGTSEVLVALLGGHVDAGSLAYGAVSEHVKAGKARYLMFYADKRFKDQPNVPTAVELGFPDAVLPTYFGLYVHKDTPEPIKKALVEVCKKISEDPETRKGIERLGEEPRFGGPEFMRDAIKKQEAIGIPILKEIGLYIGK